MRRSEKWNHFRMRFCCFWLRCGRRKVQRRTRDHVLFSRELVDHCKERRKKGGMHKQCSRYNRPVKGQLVFSARRSTKIGQWDNRADCALRCPSRMSKDVERWNGATILYGLCNDEILDDVWTTRIGRWIIQGSLKVEFWGGAAFLAREKNIAKGRLAF